MLVTVVAEGYKDHVLVAVAVTEGYMSLHMAWLEDYRMYVVVDCKVQVVPEGYKHLAPTVPEHYKQLVVVVEG